MSFSERTINQIEAARSASVAEPNVDTWRFLRGMKPTPPTRVDQVIAQLRDLAAEYDHAASLYADADSVRLMTDLLRFRALGPERVKLDTNRPTYWQAYEDADRWRVGEAEKDFPPFAFEQFRVDYSGQSIDLDCWRGNVVFSYLLRQYAFQRPQTAQIAVRADDYVIDAGVCFGDTALGFAASVGPKGRVFGFEPSPRQLAVAVENVARNPDLSERIHLYDRATSDRSDEMVRFSARGAGSNVNPEGDIEVRTISIDDFVQAEGLARVDFIKMDIEGSEGAALEGAAKTIRDRSPVLAISAYHRKTDLYALPAQINRLNPSYRLYLDHYTIHLEETVIFAVPV